MPGKFIVIFMTVPSKKEAKSIISALMSKRLVACANLIDRIDSKFVWKGKIDTAKECLVIFKTGKKLFKKAAAEIKKLHSYEVPEIIALPIIDGNKEYLGWLEGAVGKNRGKNGVKRESLCSDNR